MGRCNSGTLSGDPTWDADTPVSAGSSCPATTPGQIVVTTEADNLDDTDCECTLREALINANSNSDTTGGGCAEGAGEDTITLAAGTYALTLAGADEDAGATGDLDVTDAATTTINGAGAGTIIDGGGGDRVFHLHGGANVALSSLTIQNGSANGKGGGVLNAGATVQMSQCTVKDNTCTDLGGGLAQTSGSVTIDGSTFSDNSSGAGGGGRCRTNRRRRAARRCSPTARSPATRPVAPAARWPLRAKWRSI